MDSVPLGDCAEFHILSNNAIKVVSHINHLKTFLLKLLPFTPRSSNDVLKILEDNAIGTTVYHKKQARINDDKAVKGISKKI